MTRLIKHLPFSASCLLTIGLTTIPVSVRSQSEPYLPPNLPTTGSFALTASPTKHLNLWHVVKSNSPKIDPFASLRSIVPSNAIATPTDTNLLVFADKYSFTERTPAMTLDRFIPQATTAAIVPPNLDVLILGEQYAFTGNFESAPVAKAAIPATVKTPTVVATNRLPTIADINLLIKLKERRVYVYQGKEVLTSYPVGIGKKGRETPTGEWQIMETIVNPGWTDFNTGKMMPPGKNNPMGSRWIGFWTDGEDMIGFHGTNKVSSIGKAVSNGCVRMLDRDVQEMYKVIKVGTIVRVVNE